MSKLLPKSAGSPSEEHLFSPERPINTLAEDELGRKDFSKSIAKVIAQWMGRDSLVIAIYGPWGSGKSSLKNMVIDALSEQRAKTISIEFNPWEWAGQGRVFEGFFRELSSKLGSADSSKEAATAARKIRMYGTMFSAAGSVTGLFRAVLVILFGALALFGFTLHYHNPILLKAATTVSFIAFAIAFILAAFGKSAEKVAQYLVSKAEDSRETVDQAKAKLKDLLSALAENVLVVIDDIDRLAPEDVRTVFQLVKVNADFPNLIYLLLLQRDAVEKALEQTGNGDGAQFLEKAVQVGFDIPKLSRTKLEQYIEAAIAKCVHGTSADNKFNAQRWARLFGSGITPHFRTLRDVKRFSNALSFHFQLYESGDGFDANPVDLIALEVLRQFEPFVYQRLYAAKEVLTDRHNAILGFALPAEKAETVKALVSTATHPTAVQAILIDVFPTVARAIFEIRGESETSQPGRGLRGEWRKELRPCHPDMFDRYFRFSLSAEDLSENELSSTLEVVGDRDSFVRRLTELSQRGLLATALIGIGVNSHLISGEKALPFSVGLFDMERQLFAHRTKIGSSEVPIDIQSVLIIRSVLQQQPVSMRSGLLRQAIEQTTALYLPTISFESTEKDRQESASPLTSASEAKLLQDLCIEKIRTAAARGALLSNPWLRYILALWAKWGHQEEVWAWFAATAESDTGLPLLLTAFAESMNNIEGERSISVQYRFALEEFSRYTKPDDFEQRIRQLSSSKTGNEVVYGLFLRALGRWKKSGQFPHPQDLDDWTTIEDI